MTRPCPPLQVLVVEDEALLAMDIEGIIEDLGHDVVAAAGSVREVAQLDAGTPPDLALVDIQLAEQSSGLDACRLILDRWPGAIVFFVTANPAKIPEDFVGAHGVIPKPFSRNGLVSALTYIAEGICAPPPRAVKPDSLVAAPAFSATWA